MDPFLQPPRVLVANRDCEARSVLQNLFNRKGCDVFQCVCTTELQEMLGAFSGERPLLSMELFVSDCDLVDSVGLETLLSVARSELAPAFAFQVGEREIPDVGRLRRLMHVSFFDDVYDRSTQSMLLGQLHEAQRRHRSAVRQPLKLRG